MSKSPRPSRPRLTQAQLDRSLKKLARALAEANYPRKSIATNSPAHIKTLWNVFNEAWKVVCKTGNHKAYNERMKQLARAGL